MPLAPAVFDICEKLDSPSIEESSAALSERISDWMLRKGEPGAVQVGQVPIGSPLLGGESTPAYKGQKAVDSGRCAIVYGSDTFRAFEEKWSGSSKERRRWILEEVKRMSPSVKLVFIEVKVTDPVLMRKNVAIKRQAMGLATCEEDFREREAAIKEFAKLCAPTPRLSRRRPCARACRCGPCVQHVACRAGHPSLALRAHWQPARPPPPLCAPAYGCAPAAGM